MGPLDPKPSTFHKTPATEKLIYNPGSTKIRKGHCPHMLFYGRLQIAQEIGYGFSHGWLMSGTGVSGLTWSNINQIFEITHSAK